MAVVFKPFHGLRAHCRIAFRHTLARASDGKRA